MDLLIRNEASKDLEQVRAILQAAFPTHAESKLVDTLRANSKAVITLVAVQADEVLGHIIFSPVSTAPPTEAKGIGLAPVAVRKDVRSQGIGSKLIQAGLDRGRELGFDYCVVLGEPRYYQRFGFERAGRFGLTNVYGVDEEFMVIRFSNRMVAGLVQYTGEFGMFSL